MAHTYNVLLVVLETKLNRKYIILLLNTYYLNYHFTLITFSDPLRTELGDKLRLTCNKTSNLFIQVSLLLQYM